MGTENSTMRHVYRQRSSLGLAAVCTVIGVTLLFSLARNWADYPRPTLVSWVLFGLAVTWAIFVRPAVLLDIEGVTLRNVLRDVHIPWTRLSHAESRWNLRVFVEDRGFTAWAISSQIERPKATAGGMFGMLSPRRLEKQFGGAVVSATPAKVTASAVARSIEQAKQEYDEAIAQGRLPQSPEGEVTITWVPLVIAVLLLTVSAVAVLSLS